MMKKQQRNLVPQPINTSPEPSEPTSAKAGGSAVRCKLPRTDPLVIQGLFLPYPPMKGPSRSKKGVVPGLPAPTGQQKLPLLPLPAVQPFPAEQQGLPLLPLPAMQLLSLPPTTCGFPSVAPPPPVCSKMAKSGSILGSPIFEAQQGSGFSAVMCGQSPCTSTRQSCPPAPPMCSQLTMPGVPQGAAPALQSHKKLAEATSCDLSASGPPSLGQGSPVASKKGRAGGPIPSQSAVPGPSKPQLCRKGGDSLSDAVQRSPGHVPPSSVVQESDATDEQVCAILRIF